MIDLRKPHLLSFPEDLADLPMVWPEGSTKKPGAKAKAETETKAPPPRLDTCARQGCERSTPVTQEPLGAFCCQCRGSALAAERRRGVAPLEWLRATPYKERRAA